MTTTRFRFPDWLFTPWVVFTVDSILSALRIGITLWGGYTISSVVLVGYGYHDVGDTWAIFGAFAVITILRWSKRRENEGLINAAENTEAIFQLIVVAGLLWAALTTLGGALSGLYTTIVLAAGGGAGMPEAAPHVFDAHALQIAVLVMASSIGIALLVSQHLIHAGKIPGQHALAAAGKEMRGDVLVEIAILAGFLGVYFFSKPWIEYLFALLVTGKILAIVKELGSVAVRSLLQVSIGKEFEKGVRKLIGTTTGVDGIGKLETYPVMESTVRIKVWVLSGGNLETAADLTRALEEALLVYAKTHGFEDCRASVYVKMPERNLHRVAQVVHERYGHVRIASRFARANMLHVRDVEFGRPTLLKRHDLPIDEDALVRFLDEHKVKSYRAFEEEPELVAKLEEAGIRYDPAVTITFNLRSSDAN